MKKLLKRVISMVLTLVILLSVVPLTTFFTTVSAITTAELNGTFESDTVGQTPHGWTLVSVNGEGLTTTDNWVSNYVLSVSNDKMSGTKSMSVAAKAAGTKGYVTAESAKIDVVGGKTYAFEYAMKLMNVASRTDLRGGRLYVREYDSNGTLLSTTRVSDHYRDNMDWQTMVHTLTLGSTTTHITLNFYLGGGWQTNPNITMLIDDVKVGLVPEDDLVNGDFEMGAGDNIYSWSLASRDIYGNVESVHNWAGNFTAKRVAGKNGKAAAVTRKGIGYVALVSNYIKATNNATYVFDYALKIENGVDGLLTKVFAQLVEYDANKNRIAQKSLHTQINDNIGWTEKSSSFTLGATTKYFTIELFVGGGGTNYFTATFDDAKLTTIIRDTKEDNINNGDFESSYNNTIFDWNLPSREFCTSSLTKEGYNGTKGLLVTRNHTEHGFANFQSNTFKVKQGQEYKLTYMVKMDIVDGACYIPVYANFYDANGTRILQERHQEFDYRTYSTEWQQSFGLFTAPEGAVTCRIEILVSGKSFKATFDNFVWAERNSNTKNFGLNTGDGKGGVASWTATMPGVKLDKTVYREGNGSLFISNTLDREQTKIYSDVLIPVDKETRYKFTAYVKSYNSDISTDGIMLSAILYDKDMNRVGSTVGHHITLNEDSTVSDWHELICGVYTADNVAYVRMYLDISRGTYNLWFDDMSYVVFSLADQFYEDFESVDNTGKPAGWTTEAVSGSPTIKTEAGKIYIEAKTDNDIGKLSVKWNTIQEYIPLEFIGAYASTTDIKLTVKYYDFANRELVEDRFEKILPANGGIMQDTTFTFMFPSLNYAIIEISNVGAGLIEFDGIKIAEYEDEDESVQIGEWRGQWTWYPEDNYKCTNSKRYFRYHVSLPEDPLNGMLQITADDVVKLWINGKEIEITDGKDDWATVSFVEMLEEYMVAGDNVLAIEVENFTSAAALLFDGYVETVNGGWVDFYSDTTILCSKDAVDGWTEKNFNDKTWVRAKILGKVGMSPWNDIEFDATAFIDKVFTVVDYTVTESMNVGEEANLTMTIIPKEDFTEAIDIIGYLWIRNTQTKALTVTLKQIDGPKMDTWKAGEQITVSYGFDVPDFIGSGRYIVQLDVNQIYIESDEIFNNKFVKAIRVTNNNTKGTTTKLVNQNGTYALSINGDIYPNMSYVCQSRTTYLLGKKSEMYIQQTGINITRLWYPIAGSSSTASSWLGEDQYDYTRLDKNIYNLLSDMPNTYLSFGLVLNVPKWWETQNPDEMVVTHTGAKPGVSFASDKFVEDSIKANMALLDYMKEQPYWNRIVTINLGGCSTSEWVWYSNGQDTQDYSPASQRKFKEYLKEKYGTDAKLQEAWNNKTVTLDTATVPSNEERFGDKYSTLLSPETQADVLDYNEFCEVVVAKTLIKFSAAVTEKVDDRIVLGAYYGYSGNVYYHRASTTLHNAMELVLKDENIDFFAAPSIYGERYDGEANGFMQMVDSFALYGKAVVVENDTRLCSYIDLGSNFYTRDAVGPTYSVSASLSQLERDFANQITTNVGQWYFNIVGNAFERKQFSDLIEIMYNESVVNLSRDKNTLNDVCVIADEDMYENLSATGFDAGYEILYYLTKEHRQQLAELGVSYDMYNMSALRDGLVPDHKVYIMLAPVELDEAEREAIEDNLKEDGKVIIWQYISGASDGYTFTAENMSDIIGINVKLDTSKQDAGAYFNNTQHWLTEGLNGKYFGSDYVRGEVSPFAYVNDSSATVLGYMSDNPNRAALAIKEYDDWTSIYSAVPNLPSDFYRNLFKKIGVHVYSESNNDVIFSNSNYVGINAEYGGEKTIKLPGTYAVYDVYDMKTISLATDTIKFTMQDYSTKLFRLTPVGSHVVYVDIVNSKGKSGDAGYNEVDPGDDFSATISAKKGYMISEIIIDGVSTEIRAKEYTVDLEKVDNSHFIKANFIKVAGEEPEDDSFPMWIIYVGAGVVLFAASFILFFLILKKKNKKEEEETQN